jgi:dCTP deaminase
MVLSDVAIRKALADGQIEIDPIPEDVQYNTSSVDVYLGDVFHQWDRARLELPGADIHLNLALQEFQKTAQAYLLPASKETDGCVLLPPYYRQPQVLLAMTRERLHLKRDGRIAARVEGRSSFARLGLMVHLTAPTIHPAFNAPITLEIVNHGPFFLRLVPNKTRICQFIFEHVDSEPSPGHESVFQGQVDAIGKIKKN